MLTPIEIMNGMIAKNHELDAKTKEYATLLDVCVECEHDYQVARAKKTLELRNNGESVTLIPTLIKTDETVADLRFMHHAAEAKSKACLQAIKDIRVMIDSYRSLLAWEKAARTEI